MQHRSHFKCSTCSAKFQGVLNKDGTDVFASDLPADPKQTEPIAVTCGPCAKEMKEGVQDMLTFIS